MKPYFSDLSTLFFPKGHLKHRVFSGLNTYFMDFNTRLVSNLKSELSKRAVISQWDIITYFIAFGTRLVSNLNRELSKRAVISRGISSLTL